MIMTLFECRLFLKKKFNRTFTLKNWENLIKSCHYKRFLSSFYYVYSCLCSLRFNKMNRERKKRHPLPSLKLQSRGLNLSRHSRSLNFVHLAYQGLRMLGTRWAWRRQKASSTRSRNEVTREMNYPQGGRTQEKRLIGKLFFFPPPPFRTKFFDMFFRDFGRKIDFLALWSLQGFLIFLPLR